MNRRFAAAVICCFLACAAESKADIVIAVDVGTATSPVQPGFMQWDLGGVPASITNPSNGVSVSVPTADAFQGNRDRGAGGVLAGSPIAALLQDFAHSSGAAPNNIPNMTLVVSGLLPNTDYKVSLFAFDRTDNNGRGTSWYFGTNSSGQHIASFFNNTAIAPTGPAFSKVFNTGAGTSLTFFGVGDFSVQGPPLAGTTNTASVVLFNGLIVETVIPEPASLTIWSVVSLAGAVITWRRRRMAVKGGSGLA